MPEKKILNNKIYWTISTLLVLPDYCLFADALFHLFLIPVLLEFKMC